MTINGIDLISSTVSKADRPDQPGAAERFNEDQATYAVRGEGVAGPRCRRSGDPRSVEDAAVATGRLSHAGCAWRRALCRQGARAEEPRHQLYPGGQAAEAAAADGLADALDDHRHDADRGRGAAARSAADQALPAGLQRASARRQKLPVHPAARRSRVPAHPEASRRAAHQRAILRPVRKRRIGHPNA